MKFLLFLNMLAMCTSCPDSFYDNILDDVNSRHSYFVSVMIKDGKSQRAVVIESGDLYDFLLKTKTFKKDECRESLKKVLKSNSVLSFETITVDENIGFCELRNCSKVEKIAEQGRDYFIQYYFNNKVIKKNISNNEQHCIIKILFDWCILVKVDDESGFLVIHE